MSTRRASFATLVVTMTIALAAAPAFAQTPSAAGRIKLASGQVFVVRGGNAIPAEVGQAVL